MEVVITMKTQELPINKIKLDKRLQLRQMGVSDDVVETYARSIECGESFPPVVVYEVEGNHWLVDGWHRLKAHQTNGTETITAEVINGTWEQAEHYAQFTANRKNGMRLTRADLDALLTAVVKDDNYSTWSSTAIAELAGVSVPTVIKKRRQLGLVPKETVTSSGAKRKGAMDIGTSFPIQSLIPGPPPPGTEAPEDGGYGVLTEKVTDRLGEHLADIEASLNKLDTAELETWMKDEQKDELVGQLDRLNRILGEEAR